MILNKRRTELVSFVYVGCFGCSGENSVVLRNAQMIPLGGKSGLFEARNAVAQTNVRKERGNFKAKG